MTDEDLDTLRTELRGALDRIGHLEQQLAASQSLPRRVAPPPVESTEPAHAVGRRRALAGLAGAAAAGVAAVAVSGHPVAADNGQALTMGSTGNTATAATGLTVQGSAAAGGLAVTDNTVQNPGLITDKAGILGHAQGINFGRGVLGVGELTSGGVAGLATGSGAGVYGVSVGGSGGVFRTESTFYAEPAVMADGPLSGGTGLFATGTTQVHMFPNTEPAPTTNTASSNRGDLRWTSDNVLWACIVGGTTGTWRKVVGTGTAGAFHLLPTPVRVYDSRAGSTPSQGPKTPLPAGNVARTIDCKHNSSGVPAGATGVVMTVLLANAAVGNGNLTIWANDKPKPQSNTMVWGGNAGRFTATALSALDAQARIKIDASLSTNVILDVVGYYR